MLLRIQTPQNQRIDPLSLFETLKNDSRKRFLLIASAIAFLAIGASQAMYGPFYGVFRNTFGLTAARVALTTTLHFGGSTAALLIGGALVRKHGSIAVTSVSAVLLTLGFAAIAVASSFIMVLAGALLVGVGFGGLQFLNFLIARVFVKHRGAALNSLNSLFGIGALLAPLGAAPFVVRNSFRPLFGIAAAFGIAVVVLLALQPHAIGREPAPDRRESRSWGFLASVLGFLLLYFFYVGAETSLTSWIPTHLVISYGDGFSARMTGLFWASLTVGRLVAIPVSDRVHPATLVRFGVLGAVCAVLLAQVETVAPVAYLIAGFCLGPFFSGGLAWIAERFPDQSSPISALVLAGGGFGAIAFPPLIGSLVDAYSAHLIPLAIAVVTACALVTAVILGLGRKDTSTSFADYVEALQRRLGEPLPGIAAQSQMAPEGRIPEDYDAVPDGARRGAVLVLLYWDGGDIVIPFIRRPEDETPHAGQIAFPGGGYEQGDTFPGGTALREAWEEIGVDATAVRILGTLSPLYIWVSNYSVYPVVGVTETPPRFTLNPTEVEDLEIVRLEALHGSRTEQTFAARGYRIVAPCFATNRVSIWGATAMMLNELILIHGELRRTPGLPDRPK